LVVDETSWYDEEIIEIGKRYQLVYERCCSVYV
jgi:hypothetical protein